MIFKPKSKNEIIHILNSHNHLIIFKIISDNYIANEKILIPFIDILSDKYIIKQLTKLYCNRIPNYHLVKYIINKHFNGDLEFIIYLMVKNYYNLRCCSNKNQYKQPYKNNQISIS